MRYLNTRTGAVVESPCVISGGDWVKETEEVVEVVETEEEEDVIRLSELTVKELVSLAEEHEIDLDGATKKDDIIAVILAAEEGAAE